MNKISTFEVNGEKYTVTVKPPFAGNVFDIDQMTTNPCYSVEITDKENRQLYFGTVNGLLAPQIAEKWGVSIETFLETTARNVVEPTLKRPAGR